MADLIYYAWTLLLVCTCCLCWTGTLFSLPGNWAIVGAAAVFAWLVPAGPGGGISWTTVIVLLVLSVVGEIVEAAAGAAGAAKLGGSRRSAVLSLVGTIIGSIAGVVVGLPIPVVGSALAALAGGAAGAFMGAMAGERWKGRSFDQQINVGRAAFLGRMAGTVGKLAIGVAMVVITSADALF